VESIRLQRTPVVARSAESGELCFCQKSSRCVLSSPPFAVLYLLPVTVAGQCFGWRGALAAMVVGLGLASYLTLAVALAVPGLLAARLSGREAGAADRSWFEMSNDLLLEASLDGYFTRLSEQWEQTFGWSREEMMSRPFRELIHPDDLAATEIHSGALERAPGTVTNFENRYLAKDGSWLSLLWSARSDGWRKYAVAHDITDRKRLEEQRHDQLSEEGALARTDALTGLPNRRAWDEALAAALCRAQAGGRSLVMADVALYEAKRQGRDRLVVAGRNIGGGGGI